MYINGSSVHFTTHVTFYLKDETNYGLIFCFTVCPLLADVMLVVDGSQTVMPENFVTLIRFVVTVTRQFLISPEATHVGLIQFSVPIDLEIGLGTITNGRALEMNITNIMYQSGGDTNTGPAIQQATNELLNSPQARNVSKIMFLFTDGIANSPSDAVSAGEAARREKIIITAVGIGITSASARENLQQITGSNNRVLLVENFNEEQLNDIIDDLTTQSCPSM